MLPARPHLIYPHGLHTRADAAPRGFRGIGAFARGAAAPTRPGPSADNAAAEEGTAQEHADGGPWRRARGGGGGHGLFHPLIDFRPMPSILFEPLKDGVRYVVYEPAETGPYKVLAIVAVILAAVVIGALTATITAGRC
jgi:hypothetical protein